MTKLQAPPKRRRGRPSKISREQVLDTARSLSAEELTMPEVAKILGVKTPALYHHFSSREALIGEVGQQLFSDMPIPDPDSANWREWLHDINMRLYRFVLANPLLIEAADSAQGFLSLTLSLCEAILDTVQNAGFDKEKSYWIMISLTQLAYAAARNQLEGRSTEGGGDDKLAEQIQAIKEHNPRSAEFMQHLPESNNEEWLEQLLRWTIDCIPDPTPDKPL